MGFWDSSGLVDMKKVSVCFCVTARLRKQTVLLSSESHRHQTDGVGGRQTRQMRDTGTHGAVGPMRQQRSDTFSVLCRMRRWCSLSFSCGSLQRRMKRCLYSRRVERRCSPMGDRLARSSARYRSPSDSACPWLSRSPPVGVATESQS